MNHRTGARYAKKRVSGRKDEKGVSSASPLDARLSSPLFHHTYTGGVRRDGDPSRPRSIRALTHWSQLASYAAASMSASTSDGSDIFTFIIHPSVYAPSLTFPGASPSASLISTTSPETGE